MGQNYHNHSEQELLQLLKQDDSRAYAEVFDRFWPLLHRFSWRMLGDAQEATDIVQDVFVVLWEQRNRLATGSSLRTYLYTVTKNRILMFIRHAKVAARYLDHQQAIIQAEGAHPDEAIYEKELAERIESCLETLPPKARRAFELSRFDQMSYREIATEMNISDSTVKQHISRALRTIRERLAGIPFLFYLIFLLFLILQ